jgi:hypothetical protein
MAPIAAGDVLIARGELTRMSAMVVAALGLTTMSACGGGESPKPSTTGTPRDAAVANCAGNECRVRVRCKGHVYVRRGSAPVRIRTSKTALSTTIIADFAGSREDAMIRC